MGKGEDKYQRDRRKATLAELARKAARRARVTDVEVNKKSAEKSAALKSAHCTLFNLSSNANNLSNNSNNAIVSNHNDAGDTGQITT